MTCVLALLGPAPVDGGRLPKRARVVARSFARHSRLLRGLNQLAPDRLSRAFRLGAFSCKFKRFTAAEIARLDLTYYWVGCFAGKRHVAWIARPAASGKNPSRRVVKGRSTTR